MSRWIVGLALALTAHGQIQIHYSRQSDAITKAIVGTVPKDVALYRADVLNAGATEARLFPARIGFAAAANAPMQDPEAALFAATNFRQSRWWVRTLKGVGLGLQYAGPAVVLLSTFGVGIPDVVTGIAGGIGGGAAMVNGVHRDASRVAVPATWLRDGLPEIILRPGESVPYLLALGGKPPITFDASIALAVIPAPSPIAGQTLETPRPIRTHPQVDDEMELEAARVRQLVAMIRERGAAMGAVE